VGEFKYCVSERMGGGMDVQSAEGVMENGNGDGW
jgi:hypothetical protein